MSTYVYRNATQRPPFEDPGVYEVKLVSFEEKFSKDGDKMFALRLETKNSVLVFENITISEKAMWRMDLALKCITPSKGIPLPSEGEAFEEVDGEFITKYLSGGSGIVELKKVENEKDGKPTGGYHNEVARWYEPADGKQKLAEFAAKAKTGSTTTAAGGKGGPF